jgi:hypothetical protein
MRMSGSRSGFIGETVHRCAWLKAYCLKRTGQWKDDPYLADRYNHTEATGKPGEADLLPVPRQSKAA